MKYKYLFLGLLAIFIIFIYLPDFTPPLYQDSSNWSFTMERIVVNGSNLGSYHSLEEGVLSIRGSVWSFSKDIGAKDQPQPILIEIYEQKDWWFDRRVGTIRLTPSPKINEEVYFEKFFGSQPASNKYYFYITRASGKDDGWNIKGSGSLGINH